MHRPSQSTVVVSPRERFSPILASLASLFSTIDERVPVVVVDGGFDAELRQRLAALRRGRPFVHLRHDRYLLPNEARNLGAEVVDTPWIAFLDNDIDYQPGWLTALEDNAERHGAACVAPLTFIGPSPVPIIHQAGALFRRQRRAGRLELRERHLLEGETLPAVEAELDRVAPVETEAFEFHGVLMRRSFFERMGGLDERLVTREHLDVSLRAKAMGEAVTFESRARISYTAMRPFVPADLDYFMVRWAEARAERSVDAFEDSWNVAVDRQRLIRGSIAGRRRRALASSELGTPVSADGAELAADRFADLDARHVRRAAAMDEAGSPRIPRPPGVASLDELTFRLPIEELD